MQKKTSGRALPHPSGKGSQAPHRGNNGMIPVNKERSAFKILGPMPKKI
jgi:hypothetical protein